MQNSTSALLNKALGREGSLGDAVQKSLVNAFTDYGFNLVGDIGVSNHLEDGGLEKIGLHALMGGLSSMAAGGDFKTGALAAGVNEAFVDDLASAYSGISKDDRDRLLLMNSQLIGVLTTAVQDPNADAAKLQLGSSIAQSGTQYNYLSHQDVEDLEKALKECKDNCDAVRAEFAKRDADNTARLNNCWATGDCEKIKAEIDEGSRELNKLWQNDKTGITDQFLHSNIADSTNARTRASLDHLPKGDPANAVKLLAAAGIIALAPEAIGLLGQYATRGAATCAANPVLCVNEAGVVIADLGLSEALPVGLGAAAGSLTTKELSDLRALMEIEAKTGAKLTADEVLAVVRPEVSKNANATSMLTDSETAALVERNVIEGTAKGAAPKVSAEGKVGGQTFQDVNQTSRPLNEADPKIPSLITERIVDKAASNSGKRYPNGNMKDAHAEIGVIQQAYSAGKTAGADMSMTVAGKDVCGFCKGDIAAAAEKAELKSLTVSAIDDKTGLPKNYYWEPGMKSIKERN